MVRSTVDSVHYGLWEYIAEAEDAESDYHEWCEGTVVDVDEESEFANDDEQSYAFVTLLILMEDGGAAQSRIWAETERIPEGEEATLKAYARFLEVVPQLDFSTVHSCALFVRPGDGGHGVMESMLREEYAGRNRVVVGIKPTTSDDEPAALIFEGLTVEPEGETVAAGEVADAT